MILGQNIERRKMMNNNTSPYTNPYNGRIADINTPIKVIEVFTSIDGEQPRMGEITTFVRLAGCNLKCNYCDTANSQDKGSGEETTVRELLKQIRQVSVSNNVTITGGEPLLQMDAVEELCQRLRVLGYNINIETNGTINPTLPLLTSVTSMVYDYKSPELFKIDKQIIRYDDIIKCVINSKVAFEVVKKVATEYSYTKVYVGCVNGEEASLKEQDLIDMIIEAQLPNLHFNTQLHKKIGVS